MGNNDFTRTASGHDTEVAKVEVTPGSALARYAT